VGVGRKGAAAGKSVVGALPPLTCPGSAAGVAPKPPSAEHIGLDLFYL